MAEILEITLEGALKTHIMYRANLSYRDLIEWIPLLCDLGLLEAIGEGKHKTYKTTKKGLRYLQSYTEIRGLLRKQREREEPTGTYRLANLIDTCLSDITDLKRRIVTLEENVALARKLIGSDIIFPLQMRLLRRFQNVERQGWIWQEFGDIVKTHDKYHSFLVVATIDELGDSRFARVSKKRTTVYEDKTGEHYLTVSYQAWLFGTPSERLPNLLRYLEDEKISKTNAVFCLDLQQSTCWVHNNTESVVFKYFERFLEDAGFRLEPFSKRTIQDLKSARE